MVHQYIDAQMSNAGVLIAVQHSTNTRLLLRENIDSDCRDEHRALLMDAQAQHPSVQCE